MPPSLQVGELLQNLLGDAAPGYPPRLAGIGLNAWACMLGYLVAENFGSLLRLTPDTEQLYCAYVRT